MKIIIDCSDLTDWYFQEILNEINRKLGSGRVMVEEE